MDFEYFYTLWAKDLAGDISEEEKAVFLSFLQSNPELQKVYMRLKSVHLSPLDKEAVNARWQLLLQEKAVAYADEAYENTLVKPFYKRPWFIAASTIGILLMSAGIWFSSIPHSPKMDQGNWATIENKPIDQSFAIRKIELPDHSIVMLNSNSKIKWDTVAFGKKIRQVELEGEGFFDIAKDASHPFVVHTKMADIRVLGTAFNVKAYAAMDKMQTSLYRGKIELTTNEKKKHKYILIPDQKISIKDDSNKMVVSKTNNLSTVKASSKVVSTDTAWMNRVCFWDNATMEDIVAELEIYFGKNIRFENPEIKGYRFSGQLNMESLDFVLSTLGNIRGFKHRTISANDFIIYK